MFKGYESEVKKIYSDLNEKGVKALKNRKDEISKTIPQVANIQKEISKLSISIGLTALKNEANAGEKIQDIKNKITDLKVNLAELLVSRNYPVNYLDMNYTCPKCKDTGYINSSTRCSCYKRYLVYVYYKKSKLSDLLQNNNFSNFDLNLYSPNKTDSTNHISPRKNMENILAMAKNYIDTFTGNSDNLLFYGGCGTGKTFLTHCIAKSLLDAGHFVIYKTADELIKDTREIIFDNNSNLSNILINCDLLVIDDLGTEQDTEFARSELFNLLNSKLIKKKPMIINTNLTPKNIIEGYSERISSRLLGNFKIYKFFGNDIRISQNVKNNNNIY